MSIAEGDEAMAKTRNERGAAVTVWAVLIVPLVTLIVGIAIDLPGQVQATRYASDVAAQAARVAGQELDTERYVTGRGLDLLGNRARRAALDYIEQAGMTGTVSIEGGATITVTTTASYEPVFLSSLGVRSLQVTGSARARAVEALEGTER